MPSALRARSRKAMFKTRLGIRQPLMFAAIGVLSTIAYLAITALASTQANRHFTFGVRGRAGLLADHPRRSGRVWVRARDLVRLRLWLERRQRLILNTRDRGR